MLSVKGIDVFYGDLQALWGVSLNIKDEEITSLIGSNGAGKSTLQMAIAGLLRPVEGSIYAGQIRLDDKPAHKIVDSGVSMVPEGRRLFPEMSVLDNLEMGAFSSKARVRLAETIAWVYDVFPVLKARRSQKAHTLSGGEQQMVAIGRALMSLPKFLLIDELSLGLAPVIVQRICQILKEVNKSKGIGIFMVEQNVRMALELADYGYIMENGRIIGQGKAEALLDSAEVKKAYLGIN
jgi:branched-chain amino acid transport system ATP-binding protein